MFSKELEDLIQATLEDGILEENEKAALVKRAQREGVDLGELEIHINSLLQRRQRELNEKKNRQEEEFEKEKAKAIGPVCPKCGKQVPPLTLVCQHCGFEFTKSKDSKVVLLLEEINKMDKSIDDKCQELRNKNKIIEAWKTERRKVERIIGLIAAFKVPTTKEDIVEFFSIAVPKARLAKKKKFTTSQSTVLKWSVCLGLPIVGGWNFEWIGLGVGIGLGIIIGIVLDKNSYNDESDEFKIAQAWRDKFDEVMIKGRSLRADPEFTQQLDYYENLLNKK